MGEEDYSINTGEIRTFSTVDYVVFSLVFAASAVIGIYYAYKDRHHNSTSVFMLAGKSMWVIPVALSLSVTFVSALSLLGNPAEMYNFNTMFSYLLISLLLAVAGTAHIFVPFFYRLKVTTVFEYLQMRFNTPVRILASCVLILQTLVYFSFILYAPSLALSSVTEISLWGSVLATGLVVTFYTTLGGMKAVLWADTLQAAVIVAGLLAALIQGCIVTGGFAKVWQVANDNGRIKFDDFSFDPSTRHSFWSVVVGGGFFWMTLYGINQAQVQRCLACPSVKKAQIALWINYPCIFVLALLTFMVGLVMFTFYVDCHPGGIISSRDQMLPLFVMDVLADFEGVPGLFVACIFSGSLSSMSSGLNAISAVTVKDLVVPYMCPQISEFTKTVITKVSVVIFGGISIGCAYLVSSLGRVLQAAYSTYSILNGPLFGMFLLGMFFPWANSVGAFIGCIASLAFMSWIGIGAFWHKISTAVLSPVKTSGCLWKNITTTTLATVTTTTTAAAAAAGPDKEDIPAYGIYTLSYLYYTITGATVVVIIGLIVSFISGHTKPSSLDPKLIFPLFDTLFPCLPECVLRPLRFGVDHTEKYKEFEKAIADTEADTIKSAAKSYIRDPDCSIASSVSASYTHKSSPSHNLYENVGYVKEEESSSKTGQDLSEVDAAYEVSSGSGSLDGVPEMEDIVTKL